ncbi:MAG: sialidase family protein [Chloroflexota bacterium]
MLRSWHKKIYKAVIFLLCITVQLHYSSKDIFAMMSSENVEWKLPKLVFETDGDISRPRLIPDFFGRMHLVFSESEARFGNIQTEYAVFYSQWQDGQEWSTPVDILAQAQKILYFPQFTISKDGMGFLSAQGYPGREYIQLAQNISGNFSSPSNWQQTNTISSYPVAAHRLQSDQYGSLHLLYGASGSSTQLYYQRSDDNGQSWASPMSISQNQESEAVDTIDILIGDPGELHVFWTNVLYPDGYPQTGTFYTYSNDNGTTWSQPTKIAPKDVSLQGSAIYGKEIHVLVIGRAGYSGRFDVTTRDAGKTWSELIQIDSVGSGVSGGGIVADSVGHFHAVFGSSVDQKVVHSSWDGIAWSPPVDIAQGISPTLEDIHLSIFGGNTLVALFVESHARIWTVEGKITNAPSLPGIPIPTRSPTQSREPTSLAYKTTPIATTTSIILDSMNHPETNTFSQQLIILVPVLCVLGLIVIVAITRRYRRR